MKSFIPALILILTLLFACTDSDKNSPGTDSLYSTPEAEGIPSLAILEFVEALDREQPDAIHSFILRRHGKIVSEGWWSPFNPDSPHMLYSLSKSFTSTAIGMAQDEGLLSVNDPVISFFPEQTPEEPGYNLESMRIRDLLRMNTGHEQGTLGRIGQSASWVEGFLSLEVEHKPGTHFMYNTGATYMLSAIIQEITGETLLDFLEPRLFEPLGIENPSWESDPDGINTGGYGLSVRTEDISKLGQLYLQKGIWNGERLISESWIEEATSLQTSNGSNPESDWDQGYGYQFWQCRHNLYRGDGAFGQYCIVMPEQDAVMAITSGSSDMQGIMNIVWDHILPAMQEKALPSDEEGLKRLNEKLQALTIQNVEGTESSPEAPNISGNIYSIEPNGRDVKSISFDFEASPCVITITGQDEEQSFKAGYKTRELGSMIIPQLVSDKIAVDGAWETPDKYALNIIYYETPHSVKHTFQFNEGQLLWDSEMNVSFGPRTSEPLKGRIK